LRLPHGAWRIGQSLRLTDGRSGRLVEVIDTDDGVEALAVLTMHAPAAGGQETEALAVRDSAPGGELESAAVDAAPLPLPYQL
jgi:hypothetical protein